MRLKEVKVTFGDYMARIVKGRLDLVLLLSKSKCIIFSSIYSDLENKILSLEFHC